MADPVSILQPEAEINSGETARLSSFVGAIAISDLVKSTLGPKGMDKILQSMSDQTGTLNVTNDGATILKSIHIDNPAAKVLVNMSKTQDAEIGDGTTSVVVLAGELLREAEKLVNQRVHPMTIIQGFRLASQAAKDALTGSAQSSNGDKAKLREDLLNIAKTTLSSKLLNKDKEKFSALAVDAILRLGGSTDLDLIQVLKLPGGSLEQSFLDDGYLLQKRFGHSQSKDLKNVKVMVANTPMDSDKIKIFGTRVKVDSLDKVAEIEEQEKRKMLSKVERIASFGCDVFINRQLIYNYPEQLFAAKGISSIEHADFDGVDRLSRVLGAQILSTFDETDPEKQALSLGYAESVREVMLGEDKFIQFQGLRRHAGGDACTVVLRGASKHVLDEAERSLHDALAVLSQVAAVDAKTVLGGGCSEMLMAQAVDELVVQGVPRGKELHAVEAFARALRSLPAVLADNGGFDAAELVAELRLRHNRGEKTMGLDMEKGEVACVEGLKVKESYKSKAHVLMAAAEAAEAILRVDYIIKAAPRRREME